MTLLAVWFAVLVPAAFACWCLAGFVLGWKEQGRLAATTLVSALVVALWFYADYWVKRVPSAEPGWDIFFALVCAVSGAFTLVATLPLYWLAERYLGGRTA